MGQGEPHGRRPDAAVSVGGQVDVHSRHHPKKTLKSANDKTDLPHIRKIPTLTDNISISDIIILGIMQL